MIRRKAFQSISRTKNTSYKFFSTKESASVSKITINVTKLLKPATQNQLSQLVQVALDNNITSFECSGIPDEDEILAKALEHKKEVTVITRFGYHTSISSSDNDESQIHINDVLVQQQESNENKKESVFHNISPEYLNHCLSQSKFSGQNLIYMVHNPETQISAKSLLGTSPEEQVQFIQEKLLESFIGLEKACNSKEIQSFGVISNGLSLPKDQLLHLNSNLLLSCSSDAAKEVHGSDSNNFTRIQLPINLMEQGGLEAAQNLKLHKSSSKIIASRPLTCYEDGGIGNNLNPLKLIDYSIPTSLETNTNTSTHLLSSIPSYYQTILNTTLQYFDATHLLEIEKHSVEQRETLEGCRFIQSMIQELDSCLTNEKFKTFQQYEDELYYKIIPLLYNTFDGLDEKSTSMLQTFFVAHGAAVRYMVAMNSRNKVCEVVGNIDGTSKLQTFALKWLLQKEELDGVVVGCSEVEQLLDVIEACNETDK